MNLSIVFPEGEPPELRTNIRSLNAVADATSDVRDALRAALVVAFGEPDSWPAQQDRHPVARYDAEWVAWVERTRAAAQDHAAKCAADLDRVAEFAS